MKLRKYHKKHVQKGSCEDVLACAPLTSSLTKLFFFLLICRLIFRRSEIVDHAVSHLLLMSQLLCMWVKCNSALSCNMRNVVTLLVVRKQCEHIVVIGIKACCSCIQSWTRSRFVFPVLMFCYKCLLVTTLSDNLVAFTHCVQGIRVH